MASESDLAANEAGLFEGGDNDDSGGSRLQSSSDYLRKAKADKQATMLLHLGRFLDIKSRELQSTPDLSNEAKAELRSNPAPKDLSRDLISNEKFCGSFTQYLGTEATWLRDTNKLLGLKATLGYASSFAEFFRNKCLNDGNGEIPSSIKDYNWKAKIRPLVQMKLDQAASGIIKFEDPKATASRNDIIVMNQCGILAGTPKGAEFCHFNNTAVTIAGRASDVSGQKLSDLFVQSKEDGGFLPYSHLSTYLSRFKTMSHTRQIHALFPHRDDLELDCYWSLAYTLVLNGLQIKASRDRHIFPTFASKLFGEGNINSKTSGTMNEWMDFFMTECFEFFFEEDDFGNEVLLEGTPEIYAESLRKVKRNRDGSCKTQNRSHSLKRHAVDVLQRNLPPHSFVERCGWIAKNIHTMFEYFFNSAEQDENAAKIISGWRVKYGERVLGGIPPSKQHITCARHKFSPFVKALFSSLYTDDQAELFEMLACIVVFRENQFFHLIDQAPNFMTEEWSDENPHPFQEALTQAYQMAHVTENERNQWISELNHGFIENNIPGLPSSVVLQHQNGQGHNFGVDPRNFHHDLQFLQQSVAQSQHTTARTSLGVSQLQHQLSSFESRLTRLEHTINNETNPMLRTVIQLLVQGQGQQLGDTVMRDIMHHCLPDVNCLVPPHQTVAPGAAAITAPLAPLLPTEVPGWEGLYKRLTCSQPRIQLHTRFMLWNTGRGEAKFSHYKSNCAGSVDAKYTKLHSAMKKFCENLIFASGKNMPSFPTTADLSVAYNNELSGIFRSFEENFAEAHPTVNLCYKVVKEGKLSIFKPQPP